MDQQTLERTRQALHGVAELVLAGPQYAESHDIRLRVTPGGFGTVAAPDLRVEGLELVTPTDPAAPRAAPSPGSPGRPGSRRAPLRDVYADGPGVDPATPSRSTRMQPASILDAFAAGDAAMRAFAPDEQPVLWPEHFDVGISLAEVNYGVSPGDARISEPYAYVGPWTLRDGAFWNQPFGAATPMGRVPDVPALVAFFREGARRASADPPAAP